MADQKSVRGNMVPPGGPTQTSDIGQGQALLPDTFTLSRMSEMFMERSEQNCIQLNNVNLGLGQATGFVINNVGLGESLELFVSGNIKIKNNAATAETVNLTPEFPFNLVSNLLVQFNGQTVIDSLSGYELLGVMAKRYKGCLIGVKRSFGAVFSQNDTRVSSAIAYVKAGNGDTTLNATEGNSLTGITSATIAAGKTGQIDFGFYLRLPFTLRDDLLLGLVPMQNNSVYCNVTITCPGVNPQAVNPASSPIYGGTANAVFDSASIQAKPTYNFWAIPVPNDPRLYAYLVSHSYMLLSQVNNPLTKTGAEALQYNLPNNYYLMGLILTIRDANGVLIDIPAKADNPYLSYNGTIRVDRRDIKTRFARQAIYYEAVPSPLGQLLWDGTDVSYLPNGTNTSKWLNMYLANNPQFVADIDGSVSVPGSFAVLREQLVPANVKIV